MEDKHFERLAGHLADRDWSDVQIINLAHKIAQSHLLSHESVLGILEYQQEVDEGNEAQKEFDRWQIARGMFDERFYEDSSEAVEPGFIRQRFEEGL